MKTSCCHTKNYRLEMDSVLCLHETCENYLRETKLVERSRFWNSVFVFHFSVFFFILCSADFSFTTGTSVQTVPHNRTPKAEQKPLTKESLRQELDIQHVICPEQVYAQILIESGHLNSFLVSRTNNLLGMRYPFKRQTTAIGIFLPDENIVIKGTQEELKKYRNKNHYAVYASWQDCVGDYKFWQDNCFKLTERYLTFLGTYYAEDDQYVAKIKQLSK